MSENGSKAAKQNYHLLVLSLKLYPTTNTLVSYIYPCTVPNVASWTRWWGGGTRTGTARSGPRSSPPWWWSSWGSTSPTGAEKPSEAGRGEDGHHADITYSENLLFTFCTFISQNFTFSTFGHKWIYETFFHQAVNIVTWFASFWKHN